MPYAVALLNVPLRSKSETSSGADSSASRTRRERSVVRPVGVGSDPPGCHYHWPIHVRPRPLEAGISTGSCIGSTIGTRSTQERGCWLSMALDRAVEADEIVTALRGYGLTEADTAAAVGVTDRA